MSKRIFSFNLLVGMGLTLMLAVGSAAETSEAESVAEDPVAKLVRVEKAVTVNKQVRPVGTALRERDRVNVPEGEVAVIRYDDSGCLYTVEGGREYEVNQEQCICQENLDASKHSRHDAIAELRDINVEAMVENEETRKRGEPRYIAGMEGMELKGGDRVVVPDVLKGEEDSAMVEYYFGCGHKVTDKHGPYTVDAEVLPGACS